MFKKRQTKKNQSSHCDNMIRLHNWQTCKLLQVHTLCLIVATLGHHFYQQGCLKRERQRESLSTHRGLNFQMETNSAVAIFCVPPFALCLLCVTICVCKCNVMYKLAVSCQICVLVSLHCVHIISLLWDWLVIRPWSCAETKSSNCLKTACQLQSMTLLPTSVDRALVNVILG